MLGYEIIQNHVQRERKSHRRKELARSDRNAKSTVRKISSSGVHVFVYDVVLRYGYNDDENDVKI